MADRSDPVAAALADMPFVVARILRVHVPDTLGRCIACGTPGTGTPHLPAPCALWTIADSARKIRAARSHR